MCISIEPQPLEKLAEPCVIRERAERRLDVQPREISRAEPCRVFERLEGRINLPERNMHARHADQRRAV